MIPLQRLNPYCSGTYSVRVKDIISLFIEHLDLNTSSFFTKGAKKWCFLRGCKITENVQYVKERFR